MNFLISLFTGGFSGYYKIALYFALVFSGYYVEHLRFAHYVGIDSFHDLRLRC